jgi:hypothetical protein
VTREDYAELYPDALCADGFDDAIIGVVHRACQPTVLLYDREKCIAILMKRDKMDREGAEEFFEFNVVGAWVGDYTPAFAALGAGS